MSYLAIVTIGPNAGKPSDAATAITESVWKKHNQYLYAVFYNPKMPNYPSNWPKNQSGVLWVEMEDSLKGKFKIIRQETSNFSFNNLDSITTAFLSKYEFSTKTGSGSPGDADGGKKGQTGIDEGNKDNAINDAKGKGGDFGFSDFGAEWNFLPDWLKNLGPWFWLACAGAGGMWFFSTDKKKVVIRLASGGITVFCTVQYLQKANLPFKIPFITGLPAPKQPQQKRLML
jgi:hypothetical protein